MIYAYLKSFIVMLGHVCKINSIKLRCLVHPSYNKNSATSVTEREKEGEMEILNSKQII